MGVCLDVTPLNKSPYDINTFWGYVPAAGKKFSPGPGNNAIVQDYGSMCKFKDVVGILLEFNEEDKTGRVTYYRNGVRWVERVGKSRDRVQ